MLTSFPNGELICTRNSTRYKWYLKSNQASTYLPKKQRSLAEQLAAKKYITLLLEDLQNECRALEYYLRHHHKQKKSAELLLKSPEYQKLLSPHFTPESQELATWSNTPYEQNQKHPEQLIHRSISGHLVRSKSEVFIDMALYSNKIPFRYEYALTLGTTTIYPDFTIRHPKTGETYYWEHFGLMDDPSYCKNSCSKLQLYTTHGIIPSIHLITTYETHDNPLDMKTVERIIAEYFTDSFRQQSPLVSNTDSAPVESLMESP